MFHGEKVTLRAIEMSDLEPILEFRNSWELRRWHGVPLPKSKKAVREWLEKATVSDPWKDGQLILAITEKKSREFLGIARLYDIRSPHLRGSIGVSIQNPKHQGKGYGSDTTLVLLWIGFHVLGLNSIYLDIMEDNERAMKTAEKMGFKRIGVFRETEFIAGEFQGLVYYDILRSEFFERYPPGSLIADGH